jgi:signal transduction histidine kinase
MFSARSAEQLESESIASAATAIRRLARRCEDLSPADGPSPSREALDALRVEFLRQLQLQPSSLDGRQVVRVLMSFDALANAPSRKSSDDGDLAVAPGMDGLVEIAHDMRSPLSSILFLVDAIRGGRSGPVTTVQERQLGLIYGAALGLSSLASDIIDLVRGGDRLVDGHPVPFSIADVMFNVRDIVTPIAEEKGLALEFKLPAVDGRVGYPGAVGRVLLNLTTNALKYTDRGSVRMGCSEVAPSRVVFWVADTGCGIPQHVRRILFNPFRRTEGRVRFSNTGLGLAICRSLLGEMRSELQVKTSQSAGTLFSFELQLPEA